MVDRDFEGHLHDLFNQAPQLDDTEQFTSLIERDLRRMRGLMLWAAGLALAGMAAGLYLTITPFWSQWSGEAVRWATQVEAQNPYSGLVAPVGAGLVMAAAALIGLVGGRRA